MSDENTLPTDEQTGTDAQRDPRTGAPDDTGVVVAGPEARALSRKMDPTVEDAYWRSHYTQRPYVDPDTAYEVYQAAYRTGYEGHGQYPGEKFEEVEAHLQRDYENSRSNSTLSWEKASPAARDAWNRGEHAQGVITAGDKS